MKRRRLSIKRTKKAQMIGQIFIFVMAALIFIMVLIFGYKALTNFSDKERQISLVQMEAEIQKTIKTVGIDLDRVKRMDLVMPSDFREICFLDMDQITGYSDNNADSLRSNYPLIHASALGGGGGKENVFLVPSADTPMFAGKLEIDEPHYLCVPVRGGRASLKVRGLGDRAKLSLWTAS